MIPLPRGCTVVYPIWIDIKDLSKDIIDWYETVGGKTKIDEYWTRRGDPHRIPYVAYGKGKWCHHHQNGEGGTRLHFDGSDASVASMFLIKFMDVIVNHNLKEHMERVEHESY